MRERARGLSSWILKRSGEKPHPTAPRSVVPVVPVVCMVPVVRSVLAVKSAGFTGARAGSRSLQLDLETLGRETPPDCTKIRAGWSEWCGWCRRCGPCHRCER
ncbi:hypothetical protein GCM10020358_79260 [Amorphoplanes nipponensis]|uniref:Uncharacterized protein n=1 Tax=Actinoplanes nipponensis TaxID=135950 RepID=A0A919JP42_9ACTN|nr:hypothetical protein Ani05nite_64040 [Actinoplanes nipponensis]